MAQDLSGQPVPAKRDPIVLSAPDPKRGWATKVTPLENAVIVPSQKRAFVQEAGVFMANGKYFQRGALWRKDKPISVEPAFPADIPDQLEGKWLWGGVLWRHFGHFIVESTGRLWPLARGGAGFRGVLFVAKSPQYGTALNGFQKAFFDLAGAEDVRVLDRPTRVENLVVPGQAFGIGPISHGTEKLRSFFHTRFATDVPAEGPDKLYISRSRVGPSKGALAYEEYIEGLLEKEGYTVFHPQNHDMSTQIARYKAAKQVVASEGSALHLFGMVARPDQDVAVLVRRRSKATKYIENHLTGFSGRAPLIIDHVIRVWRPEDRSQSRYVRSEIDVKKTQQTLLEKGFVSGGPKWEQPSVDEVEAALNTGERAAKYALTGKQPGT